MTQTPTIKRLLAASMLVIFAFSMTPRKWLHDLVADHKDSYFSKAADDGTLILHKAAINCHTESIVAESPFTNDAAQINVSTPSIFSEKQPAIPASFVSTAPVFSRLRGPPSII